MKEVTIPLAGTHNQRDDAFGALSSSKDQRFINCVFNAVRNPITGSTNFYVEKRPGWASVGTVKSGERCRWATPMLEGGAPHSLFAMSDGVLYTDTGTSAGALSGVTGSCFATLPGGTYLNSYTIFCTGSIYYLKPVGFVSGVTGDTTNTSPVVTNLSQDATRYNYIGQIVTGTGIPANTRILSVDSATQITLNQNATATNTGVALSFTALALVTDSDCLGGYSAAQKDGYLFAGTTSQAYNGRIQNSDLNSITSYGASNYLPFNESFDNLVYVVATKSGIVGFGEDAICFYTNSGNPSGSPLSRVTSSMIDGVGVYAGGSNINGWPISQNKDSVFFASNSDNGIIGIYKLTGYELQKVSTPQEDAILSTESTTTKNIVVNTFAMGGYNYVLVNTFSGLTPSAHAVSLVYNIELNLWCEWSGNLHTFVFNDRETSIPVAYGASIVSTDGKYYQIPNSSTNYVWQDDGAAYTMTIQTSKTDFGTDDGKSIAKVALIGSDKQASGTATLEFSDDDYANWTTAGTFDMTSMNPKIHNCGAYKGGRAWRITHSANTAFRAQSLKFYLR